jgi:hypothetical protein
VPEFIDRADSFVHEYSQGDGTDQKPRGGNKRVLVHAARPAKLKSSDGWEEPAGNACEEKRRVEVQWFTVE